MFNKTHIVFLLVCLSLLSNALYGSSSDSAFVLNCGSEKGGKDSDGREWKPDLEFLKTQDSQPAKASYQDPSLLSTVPYMEARIFKSEGAYEFKITPKKRYLLRLHFYPSSYSSINIVDSYFGVTANEITLLNNFSAPITAQALTQSYIVREFSLAPMDSDLLKLSFKPSDQQNGAFAFVNGIELIPIPDLFESATLVGFQDQSVDTKNANMQTMYRLNVAGQFISANKDADGLARTWYDDTPYLFGAATGVNLQATDKIKIDYANMSESVAPVDIYRTARAMGPTKDLNTQFNLTWLFQADANFTYVLRLHFCEFQLDKVNQRVFNVYINNKTAQDSADIIGWTGGKGKATFKDYAVYVEDKEGDEEIQLGMTPSILSKPEYYDSQLNGLEVFKLQDEKKNLAGPNPRPSDMLIKAEGTTPRAFHTEKSKTAQVIGGAAGGAAAVVVAALCIAVYQRKRRYPGTDSHTSSWLPLYGNSQTSTSKSTVSGKSNSSHLSKMAQGLCRHFSWAEMLKATKNFEESNVIGVGGFGKVYKGVIDGGTKVAIKRSNPNSEQGVNEFVTEIEMLSKLRHKHLVSLIGFCAEDEEMCLVYDYMALGTLREHLYKSNKPHLPWKQRLQICIGAARGLHYLHTGAQYTIIHRDVKTTNILLDENWVAKVSDFGLSKTGPNMENGHVSTVVKGSFGYLDPEYFRRQQLTEKSDVYSFGVVLFEVLCARPALNPSLSKEQVSLADWALLCSRKGTLEDIIDPHLKGKITPECLKKFAETAEKCLSDHGLERPTIHDVLWNLESCLQLQEGGGSGGSKHGSRGSDVSEEHSRDHNINMHMNTLSLGSDADFSGESEELSNGAIFSQIVNPKGR